MNTIQHSTARRVRAALVTTAIAGASVAGLLGTGAAQASTASHRVAGIVIVDECTGVLGKITYSPGLRKTKVKAERAVLSGTISGCTDATQGPMSGTGTLTAILSGKASLAAENFSGTFTINWPVSSGFNPSTGTLTVRDSNGMENVSGSVTGGADTGTVLAMQYVISGDKGSGSKKRPVTLQTFDNSQSLTLSRNEG
jgi:hypothetical protein